MCKLTKDLILNLYSSTMRNGIFVFLISLFLASCGGNDGEKTELSDSFTVSLDTVMVDAGEEFIYLQENLWLSKLNPDRRYLINFNREDAIAEWIDLDELKLKKVLQFDKDGPNSIPQYTSGFLINEDENILFWNYRFYKIFDQNGQLVRDLELEKIASDLLSSSDIYPNQFFMDPENPSRTIGLFIKWEESKYLMIDFNLESGEFREIDLPQLEKIKEYKVDIVYDGNMAGSYGPGVYSTRVGCKIFLSTNTYNEVQVFDLETDSITVKTWDTPLLGARRAYLPPSQVDGQTGEIEEIVRNAESDITYGPLFWNPDEEKFYRFSHKNYFGEEKTEYGRYIPTRADVYLSVFSKDLNLIKEAFIPELIQEPKRHFVKDGQIWIFENIEDEVGFVRLSVE